MIKNIVEQLGAEQIREMARLPKNFDLNLIDFDYGFRTKIEPIISNEMLSAISQQPTADSGMQTAVGLIVKAGVFYSLVLDIPKIKVHLSNYGIGQHEQGKAKNAQWWDVRDLGLSWLKKADECLLQGLAMIKTMDLSLLSGIPFFEQSFPLVSFDCLNAVYPLASAEVFLRISKIIRDLFDELMSNFQMCMEEFLLYDPALSPLVKKYLLYKALFEAMNTPGLTFLSRGIVVQYEELPWQKSAILGERAFRHLANQYLERAELYLEKIWEYISAHAEEFPCYTPPETNPKVKIIRGKGGVFL